MLEVDLFKFAEIMIMRGSSAIMHLTNSAPNHQPPVAASDNEAAGAPAKIDESLVEEISYLIWLHDTNDNPNKTAVKIIKAVLANFPLSHHSKSLCV